MSEKKVLIIGSGFNALATAHLLKKKGYNLEILYERDVKGVLGSVKIEDENFDLSYQFFDGLDKETEIFIRDMFSNQDLYNFKYGASTYSNNFFYKDHAIIYWPAYGKIFVAKAFFSYFIKFLKNFFTNQSNKNFKNLSEYYDELPSNIKEIINKGCIKNYQISSDLLSVEAQSMSTITCFRQTLFGDNFSNFLKKKSNYFDRVLASRRVFNPNLENISLYPKGKNMEFITDKLINRLTKEGVLFKKHSFDEIEIQNIKNEIIVDKKSYDKVIMVTNLTNTERALNIKTTRNLEHFISQVFVYFTIKKLNFSFQYTQVNDINMYCSRISNCSLYSKLTKKNNHVLIAEMPLKINDKLWQSDQELIDISWDEIQKCGIVKNNDTYETAKVLKIPKTFAVPKVRYFVYLNEVHQNLKKKYNEKIDFIGQGIFTRHYFVKELLKKFN